MSAEDRLAVEGFAATHGLRVEWDGQIGFGRECVGLLDGDRDVFVRWGREEKTGPPDEARDAYHKDDYIAILGLGDAAEAQLAAWCRVLAERGVRFERRPKMIPDLSSLVHGYADEMTAVAATSVVDYDEMQRVAEPFRRDDFDPAAYLRRHGLNPEDVTRFAFTVVHASTVYSSPTPDDLDVAAVFIQGLQYGLAFAEQRAERPA